MWNIITMGFSLLQFVTGTILESVDTLKRVRGHGIIHAFTMYKERCTTLNRLNHVVVNMPSTRRVL